MFGDSSILLHVSIVHSFSLYSPHSVVISPFSFLNFLFYFIYDSHREREREKEREAETQAEGEAGSMHREPDVGFNPGSPGSHPGPKAGTKPLTHQGCPLKNFLKFLKRNVFFYPLSQINFSFYHSIGSDYH